MKHTMLTCIVLCLFTLPLHVQPAASQSNADAVYESMEHTWELLNDGSTVYIYRHTLKYLSYYAFNRAYGESFIIYDPNWQKLDVTRSITTMADGKKVESPFNAYNEVLPGWAAASAPYLHLREMVVTHAGLEVGATVDFEYSISTRKGFMPGLSGQVIFGSRSPITSLTVNVIVPSGTTLRHGVLRADMRPEINRQAGKDVYTWKARDLPLYEVEASQPPMDDVLPVLYFSTASYTDIARHVLSDTRLLEATPAMNALAEKWTENITAPRERAAALRRWVADNVARMSGPLHAIGYRPAAAASTFEKRVGSDLDRAVLLAALCRAVKLDADVALASHNYHENLSAPQLFPHALVECRHADFPGGVLLLDAAVPMSGPFSFSPELVYVPLSSRGAAPKRLSMEIPGTRVGVTSVLILKDDLTVAGKSMVEMHGGKSHALDTAGMRTLVNRALATAGQGMKVTPGELRVTSDYASSCEADLSGTAPLKQSAGYIRFIVPVAPGGVSDISYIPSDVRRATPVQLPLPIAEECRLTLHLPSNLAAVGGEGRIEFRNAVGSISSVIRSDAHDVEVTRSIVIDRDRIEVEHFPDLKALLDAWRDPSHRTILLRVKEGGR
jgi:hypothetical protein